MRGARDTAGDAEARAFAKSLVDRITFPESFALSGKAAAGRRPTVLLPHDMFEFTPNFSCPTTVDICQPRDKGQHVLVQPGKTLERSPLHALVKIRLLPTEGGMCDVHDVSEHVGVQRLEHGHAANKAGHKFPKFGVGHRLILSLTAGIKAVFGGRVE